MTNSKRNKKILKGLFVIGLMLFSIVPISAIGGETNPNLNDSNLTDKISKYLSNEIKEIYDHSPLNNNKSKRDTGLISGESIQDAIDKASSGDVIKLDSGTYAGGIRVNKSNITIKPKDPKSIPIIEKGNNPTENPGFTISDAENITIEGLTIKDFSSNSEGGGISIFNSSANIINCTIKENKASKDGGGIWIKNWYEEEPEKGEYFGKVIYFNKSVNIIGCNIHNNKVSEGTGGGIYITGRNTTTVINSSINNNTASSSGGGIYAEYSTILNSNITNNKVSGVGGGITLGVIILLLVVIL
ncbi:MAG: Pseudogene of conserved hypothetical protein [Methanobrevibacter sp. CfCl-M3]